MAKKLNVIGVGVDCNVPVWPIMAPDNNIVAVFTDLAAAKAHFKKLDKAEPNTYSWSGKMHTNKPIPQCVGFKGPGLKKPIYV